MTERILTPAGTLYPGSHVELRMEVCARLAASPDIADCASDTHWNRCRNEREPYRCSNFAQDAEAIALTGDGEINGSASAFPNAGSVYRPMMIRLLRCRNVRLSGLRLRPSSKRYPVHDIRVRNCRFSSVCAGVCIGLKSIGDIFDVELRDRRMENVWREGIKIGCAEGGTIRDTRIDNIGMRNVRRPVFLILNDRIEPEGLGSSPELTAMPEIGRLEDVTISNIRAADGPEMSCTHRRFGKDMMGPTAFNGIRTESAAIRCGGVPRCLGLEERYPALYGEPIRDKLPLLFEDGEGCETVRVRFRELILAFRFIHTNIQLKEDTERRGFFASDKEDVAGNTV